MQRYYKYQYRFNASHSFDYKKEHAHPHTFTVTIYISRQDQDEQILFFDIDKIINRYLAQYEHCYLNDLPAFETLIPNLENLGDTFFDDIHTELQQIGIQLYQLDIAENPLSVYQVCSRIHLPSIYHKPNEE